MNAEAIADLLHARRTSAGRWQAKCPAHDDRWPSLSIRDWQDGRVLVHCFAGCSPDSILRALRLTWPDVNGKPLSPEQRRQAAAQRAQREASERARRQAHTRVCATLVRLELVSRTLGARLMSLPSTSPNASALTRLFHDVQDRIRTAESWEMELRP